MSEMSYLIENQTILILQVMTVVMTQMEVLLQMSQKVKFYSKSYEIRLKLLKPDFHLRLFLCAF